MPNAAPRFAARMSNCRRASVVQICGGASSLAIGIALLGLATIPTRVSAQANPVPVAPAIGGTQSIVATDSGNTDTNRAVLISLIRSRRSALPVSLDREAG